MAHSPFAAPSQQDLPARATALAGTLTAAALALTTPLADLANPVAAGALRGAALRTALVLRQALEEVTSLAARLDALDGVHLREIAPTVGGWDAMLVAAARFQRMPAARAYRCLAVSGHGLLEPTLVAEGLAMCCPACGTSQLLGDSALQHVWVQVEADDARRAEDGLR